MTRILRYIPIAVLSIILFSCEKPYMEVTSLDSEYVFAKDAGEFHVFAVNTNTEWTIAKSDLDWLEIVPMSGCTDTIVTLTCKANPEYSSRQGTFTFKSESITRTIKVKQASNYGEVTVSGALSDFPFTGAIQTLEVNSTAPWEAVIEGDWFTVTPSSGSEGKTQLTISVPEHIGASLAGKVTIRVKGDEKVLVFNQLSADEGFAEFLPGDSFTWAICNGASATSAFMKDASWKEIGGWRDGGKQYADNPSQMPFASGDAAAARNAAKAACNKHPLVYIEWVKADASAGGYGASSFLGHNSATTIKSSGFGFTGETSCAFFIDKVSFQTNDAYVYHLPVRHIDAGKEIVLHFGMSSTSPKKQKYWAIEYSYDNGQTWTKARTKQDYPQYDANFLLPGQASVAPGFFKDEAYCPVDKALDYTTVLIRLRIANSETISGVAAGEVIGNFGLSSSEYDGPWIELK